MIRNKLTMFRTESGEQLFNKFSMQKIDSKYEIKLKT